jgi:hypothetical protein
MSRTNIEGRKVLTMTHDGVKSRHSLSGRDRLRSYYLNICNFINGHPVNSFVFTGLHTQSVTVTLPLSHG